MTPRFPSIRNADGRFSIGAGSGDAMGACSRSPSGTSQRWNLRFMVSDGGEFAGRYRDFGRNQIPLLSVLAPFVRFLSFMEHDSANGTATPTALRVYRRV